MRLIPGKLYRITKVRSEHFFLFECGSGYAWCQAGDLVLFLEKGRRLCATNRRYAYTPYYFLFGENKIELRKYYDVRMKDIFEEAGE